MKKTIIVVTLFVLFFNAHANQIDDLNVSDKVKQQLMDGFELKQSIESYRAQKGGGFVTVGGDTSCDFRIGTTKIQDAIDAGNVEIRVATNDTYNENIIVINKNLTLKGGYVDCAAAVADNQTDTTTISGVGGANQAVMIIGGDDSRYNIVLDSLILANGTVGASFSPGGGISFLDSNAQVSIINTFITANSSRFGGGISIFLGDTDISMFDSVLFFNTAESGGGIFCTDPNASIFMDGVSGIISNTANGIETGASATGNGGGIYLSNGCQFTSYSGTEGGGLDFRGIAGNEAYNHGGGVYAGSGARVVLIGHQECLFIGFIPVCFGDNTNPFNLNDNTSSRDATGGGNGGGAYLTGDTTSMAVYAGKITENKASNGNVDGGGVYLNDNAALLIDRVVKNCWNQQHCNYIGDNQSGSATGWGGAILNNGSLVNVFNTVFEGNRADLGTVIYATNANSVTTIKSSILHHNGNNSADGFNDQYVLRANVNAQINVHHSTIADNNALTAVFGFADSTGFILSSIVHDASSGDVYDLLGTNSIGNDCSIFHESASIPSLATTSIVDNPEFIDRANNNYHINATLSPAVDFCDDDNTAVDYRDIDFEDFGWDDPSVPNQTIADGGFDVGADETYANDIIFKNGFD